MSADCNAIAPVGAAERRRQAKGGSDRANGADTAASDGGDVRVATL